MRTPTALELEVEARTVELNNVNEALRREVYERIRIEEHVREQREWLHVIVSSLGEGIVATDTQGRITLLNPTAEQLMGLRQADTIGEPLDKVLRKRWEAAGQKGDCTELYSDSHVSTRQTVMITRDGQERIVEQQSNSIRVADSRIAGYVLTLQDVTDRIRSEESLHLRDRAIGAASQGILITNSAPGQPVVFASAGFQRMTYYEPSEVIGRNCRFLQGPDTDPNVVQRIRQTIETAQPCTVELINYRKDGTPFWNELSISPVRDESGELTHFVGVQTDISSRKLLEDQLQQSQKLESIGRLAGGVAHDFNNMLTVINGCCDLAMQELSDHASAAPLLREIRTAGERAANLTRQLLTLSRRQLITLQTLDLNQIVAEMEQMLGRLVGEHTQFSIELAPDLWPIRSNRGRTEQLLLNLAVNARDAMPNGGRLSISTRNLKESRLAASGGPLESYVVLEVSDTGVGIDEDALPHIFEPFFTTKATGSGTGMGLTVVHGIVTQAGGRIEVESQVGQGTKFCLYLPRAADGLASTAQPQAESTGLPHGTETVLIVEDERGVRSLLETTLRRCGYNVLVAADSLHALRLSAENEGRIAMLITDVVMPEIGGGEVAREFLSLHKRGKVLFISGYTDDAMLHSGVEVNDTNFLEKPFTPSALARKVRETLDR